MAVPGKGDTGATLHPALGRAWEEASACLRRGGTYILRTSPAGTVLMPVPAWKLRMMTAMDFLQLTGAAEEQPQDATAGSVADAASDVKQRRAAARKEEAQTAG